MIKNAIICRIIFRIGGKGILVGRPKYCAVGWKYLSTQRVISRLGLEDLPDFRKLDKEVDDHNRYYAFPLLILTRDLGLPGFSTIQ